MLVKYRHENADFYYPVLDEIGFHHLPNLDYLPGSRGDNLSIIKFSIPMNLSKKEHRGNREKDEKYSYRPEIRYKEKDKSNQKGWNDKFKSIFFYSYFHIN